MRLLRCSEGGMFTITEFIGEDTFPPYAILSHTWEAEKDEPTLQDLLDGTAEAKKGYDKIRFCGEQAARDGLEYFWVDSCCINKNISGELSEAINSMFNWYRNSARCYVYLSDVPRSPSSLDEEPTKQSWDADVWRSRWWTRGWTLQELLAPTTVEFFSSHRQRLGDRISLKHEIHQFFRMPVPVLEGTSVFQFSVDERLKWMYGRETKIPEDMVYALLGVFDIRMPLNYGEGYDSANHRLQDIVARRGACIRDLRTTNPDADRKRIQEAKGGLLGRSCRWVFSNTAFKKWRSTSQNPILWIKGDPGKGKTMLLCGIIGELSMSLCERELLAYFFCQATDSRINNANAVLRGLIYMLVNQQPSLCSHIEKGYEEAGKALFEDANAWVALIQIFTNILQDSKLKACCLIVDALDECTAGMEKLLDLVISPSCAAPHVKWIVSSRNWPEIARRLDRSSQKQNLSLELNDNSISEAVQVFIEWNVEELARQNQYKVETQNAVQRHLSSNADGTFLWVALVCQELIDVSEWKVRKKLTIFPPGLNALYRQMFDQIKSLEDEEDARVCQQVLAVVSTVYRPLSPAELASLIDELDEVALDNEALLEIIGRCGSFLTFREGSIFWVHQSAKEYIVNSAKHEKSSLISQHIHLDVFLRSLQVLHQTLKRDLYSLGELDTSTSEVKAPDPDPLSSIRYSCIYWVDHLLDCDPLGTSQSALLDNGPVHAFLKKRYLYWLEALSLCRTLSTAVNSTARLEALLQDQAGAFNLFNLVQDAHRFVTYHKVAIEDSPLQAYASALLFSPDDSLIRFHFKHEEPEWIQVQTPIRDPWSARLRALGHHQGGVSSVAFSHDSTRLASGSIDSNVRIWDLRSDLCLKTLRSHIYEVTSVLFSHDSALLVSCSKDRTVKVWNPTGGYDPKYTLEGHTEEVQSLAFSQDSTRLASGSLDETVKIWDLSSGICIHTLQGHGGLVQSVAYSLDSALLASSSKDGIVRIWNSTTGACMRTFGYRQCNAMSLVFSHDSNAIVSGSSNGLVQMWETSSGVCMRTFKTRQRSAKSIAIARDLVQLAVLSHSEDMMIWNLNDDVCTHKLQGQTDRVISLAFSHNSKWLASGSMDRTIKIWDVDSGACVQNLGVPPAPVSCLSVSSDSSWMAWGSQDRAVRVWNSRDSSSTTVLNGHLNAVHSVVFSHDCTRLASISKDCTLKIWDLSNGACAHTLKVRRMLFGTMAFSPDSTLLALSSHDDTVKIWSLSSGVCLRTLQLQASKSFLSLSPAQVALSHSSTLVAAGLQDGRIEILDYINGICVHMLEAGRSVIDSVAFSHDSTRLASSSSYNTVRIWSLVSGTCIQTLHADRRLRDLSFDDTGLYLMSEIGFVDLRTLQDSVDSYYQTSGISPNGVWFIYNSKKVLWIPPEYRSGIDKTRAGKSSISSCSDIGKICIYSFGDRLELEARPR